LERAHTSFYERRLLRDEELAQPWAADKEIRKATPSFTLTGTESGGRSFVAKEDAGKYVIRNATDGIDELTIDPASKAALYRALGLLWVKTASPTPGTGGAYGTVLLNPADLQGLFKDGVYIAEIDVDSSSSAASTSVTTSATVYGLEI